jgi:protocatechuate 3,4-dioxygenase beta subunit
LKGDLGVEIEVGKHDFHWLSDGAVLDYLQGKHTARYLAKRGTHYPVQIPFPERSGERLRFGPQVDGLRAAVELVPTNGTYVLGQAIEVRVHIRNEADYEIQVASSEWRQGDKLVIEDETGQPAEDDLGRPIMTGQIDYSGISRTRRAVLKPGESAVLKSSGLAFLAEGQRAKHPVGHYAKVKPGRYMVRFQVNFYENWNAQLMDWQGKLETGPVAVELNAAATDSQSNETKGAGSTTVKASSEDPAAYFSGRVVDDETGQPIAEFMVQLGSAIPQKPEEIRWRQEFNGATLPQRGNKIDNQGKFWASTYQAYNNGKAWARVLADGYLPQTVTSEPVASSSRAENLVVRLKKGRELRGSVLDRSGQPLVSARVFLAGTQGLTEAQQQLWFKSTTAITDADGHFTLHGVGGPGQKVTAFSSNGLEATPAPIPEPGQELKITIP